MCWERDPIIGLYLRQADFLFRLGCSTDSGFFCLGIPGKIFHFPSKLLGNFYSLFQENEEKG